MIFLTLALFSHRPNTPTNSQSWVSNHLPTTYNKRCRNDNLRHVPQTRISNWGPRCLQQKWILIFIIINLFLFIYLFIRGFLIEMDVWGFLPWSLICFPIKWGEGPWWSVGQAFGAESPRGHLRPSCEGTSYPFAVVLEEKTRGAGSNQNQLEHTLLFLSNAYFLTANIFCAFLFQKLNVRNGGVGICDQIGVRKFPPIFPPQIPHFPREFSNFKTAAFLAPEAPPFPPPPPSGVFKKGSGGACTEPFPGRHPDATSKNCKRTKSATEHLSSDYIFAAGDTLTPPRAKIDRWSETIGEEMDFSAPPWLIGMLAVQPNIIITVTPIVAYTFAKQRNDF